MWPLLVAFATRIIFLTDSLWLDEAIEALALRGQLGPLWQYALADFQPPLYHFLLWGWTTIFGTSEVALRFPSFLASLGVVFFGAKLAHLLGGEVTARRAAWLLALNPLLLYYAAEGRTYALTTFFVVWSFWAIVRRHWSYPLAVLGVVGTSYLGWFVLVGQGIWHLLSRQWRFLFQLILGVAPILLWIPSFFSSLSIGQSTMTASPNWAKVVGGLSLHSLALTWVKFNLGRISFPDPIYLGIVAPLALAQLSLLWPLTAERWRPTKLILVAWLLIPGLLILLVSWFLPVFAYFRVLFMLPAFLILLSLLCSSRRSLYHLMLVVSILASLYYGLNPTFHKEAWRQLTQAYPAGTIYALPSLNQNAPLLYYGVARTAQLDLPTIPVSELPPHLVYIRYAEDLFDPSGVGRAKLLETGYTKVAERVFTGLAVEEYRR